LFEKCSIRLNKTTHVDQLILILGDPVDDEEDRPQTDPPMTMRDLKKWEELVHSS
jgi:hypothetical protein